MLLPLALRGQQRRVRLTHGRNHIAKTLRQRLPGQLLEFWLGIERVDMAGTALHEQEDHALGPRLMMRRPRR
jgi:hypothetical protein